MSSRRIWRKKRRRYHRKIIIPRFPGVGDHRSVLISIQAGSSLGCLRQFPVRQSSRHRSKTKHGAYTVWRETAPGRPSHARRDFLQESAMPFRIYITVHPHHRRRISYMVLPTRIVADVDVAGTLVAAVAADNPYGNSSLLPNWTTTKPPPLKRTLDLLFSLCSFYFNFEFCFPFPGVCFPLANIYYSVL